MPDITNVNLAFLRKARGLAPLSRFAVQDDGSALVSAPDEMEVRTFHIVRFAGSGRAEMLETYNVETLRKTEIGGEGAAYLGTTDDDLYLFREGRKSRFLPDRRASYTDVALDGEGLRFAAAFCDLLQSGHTVALGEMSGRLLWTKDIPFPVARVAVDRGGRHIAVAGDSGDLLLLDSSRRTLWSHRQAVPLRAVATIGPSRTFFACGDPDAESGGVGAVDAEGVLLWFTELTGDPIEIAVDAAAQTIAVLCVTDAHSGRLVFLAADGLPTWDIEYEESRPTGISVAPSGRFVAVSLRDGTLGGYEVQLGERVADLSQDSAAAQAREAIDAGRLRLAIEFLQNRLLAVPSDADACRLLATTQAAYCEQALAAAQTAEAVEDWNGADLRLAEAAALCPLDVAITQARQALRRRWAAARREAGFRALAVGAGEAAEAAFREAIDADPLEVEAREGLGEARFAASREAMQRGRMLLEAGDAAGALGALIEARQRGSAGPEVADLVRAARVAEALALGNQLYQDRQYAAALFQFKKVLRLEPAHAEAQQKIGYAQNFLQDTQLSDRFSRLE